MPWPLINVTFDAVTANEVNIAANCNNIAFTTCWRATPTGNLRKSKVGLSHGPNPQIPRPSGIAKS